LTPAADFSERGTAAARAGGEVVAWGKHPARSEEKNDTVALQR
jgi:hypothetical protein